MTDGEVIEMRIESGGQMGWDGHMGCIQVMCDGRFNIKSIYIGYKSHAAKFRFIHCTTSSSNSIPTYGFILRKVQAPVEDSAGGVTSERADPNVMGEEADVTGETPTSVGIEKSTVSSHAGKHSAEGNQQEVIVVDDSDEADKLEADKSPKDVVASASGTKLPDAIDADEDETSPKRPSSGNPYAIGYRPSSCRTVPYLRNLPEVNKCGWEEECGSLTKKERGLFTSFFGKHPRRLTVDLKEYSSVFKLFGWSRAESRREL